MYISNIQKEHIYNCKRNDSTPSSQRNLDWGITILANGFHEVISLDNDIDTSDSSKSRINNTIYKVLDPTALSKITKSIHEELPELLLSLNNNSGYGDFISAELLMDNHIHLVMNGLDTNKLHIFCKNSGTKKAYTISGDKSIYLEVVTPGVPGLYTILQDLEKRLKAIFLHLHSKYMVKFIILCPTKLTLKSREEIMKESSRGFGSGLRILVHDSVTSTPVKFMLEEKIVSISAGNSVVRDVLNQITWEV